MVVMEISNRVFGVILTLVLYLPLLIYVICLGVREKREEKRKEEQAKKKKEEETTRRSRIDASYLIIDEVKSFAYKKRYEVFIIERFIWEGSFSIFFLPPKNIPNRKFANKLSIYAAEIRVDFNEDLFRILLPEDRILNYKIAEKEAAIEKIKEFLDEG